MVSGCLYDFTSIITDVKTKFIVKPFLFEYIRNQKVMLDKDLAELYGVETKHLKRQVKRNIDRFPKDFMFELTKEENDSLRRQNVTLKRGEHSKYMPYAFTEHGILMLSSVLNSDNAVQVNVQIMRVFTKLRQTLSDLTNLKKQIDLLTVKSENHDLQIKDIISAINYLIAENKKSKPIEHKKINTGLSAILKKNKIV